MRHLLRFAAPLVASAALAACGGSSKATGDDEPDAGQTEADAATSACDEVCTDGKTCNPDTGLCQLLACGSRLDLTYVAPNFGIVLDRSCSMKAKLAGTQTSKWQAAVASLGAAITAHETDVRWGLTMFPDTTGNACSQDAIPLPLQDGNGLAIKNLLTAALDVADPYFPDSPCVTNIDTGIQQAATDPGLADPARKSYLMLVTDGAQSACNVGGGDTGTENAIRDLNTLQGIKTFVVGFGSAVDDAALNSFASKGGTALAGATKYYKADTAADLATVFTAISDIVVACDYLVDPAPDDLAQTWVYYNNTELIGRDPTHADGWDYDAASMKLTFYGTSCQRLQTHAVTDVDVVFGCPTPPIL